MIWSLLFLSFGLASAVQNVHPEYLDELRESGQDEKFAELLGMPKDLVRPNDDQRSEGSIYNNASYLGDILLSEEQERQGMNFKRWPFRKWPDQQIPYWISSQFDSNQRSVIANALNAFNGMVLNLNLVPWSGHKDYVYIFNGNGCWSYLGKLGGEQPLSLQSNGCVSRGIIHHQFMHVLGMAHEHNRADRDRFVTVLWANIPSSWQSQYQKVDAYAYPNIAKYDYDSIMHYGIFAPDTIKDAFLLPNDIDRNRLGQRSTLSRWDIFKVNVLYR